MKVIVIDFIEWRAKDRSKTLNLKGIKADSRGVFVRCDKLISYAAMHCGQTRDQFAPLWYIYAEKSV